MSRFYAIGKLMAQAFKNENYDKARQLANEYLDLATTHEQDWNCGNALHDANAVLGLVSLKENDLENAKKSLLKAGQTPGSPQLNSFGPSLELAKVLLSLGQVDAVTEYLQQIKRFWPMDRTTVDAWLDTIGRGGRPFLHRFYGGLPPGFRASGKIPPGMLKPDIPG